MESWHHKGKMNQMQQTENANVPIICIPKDKQMDF